MKKEGFLPLFFSLFSLSLSLSLLSLSNNTTVVYKKGRRCPSFSLVVSLLQKKKSHHEVQKTEERETFSGGVVYPYALGISSKKSTLCSLLVSIIME